MKKIKLVCTVWTLVIKWSNNVKLTVYWSTWPYKLTLLVWFCCCLSVKVQNFEKNQVLRWNKVFRGRKLKSLFFFKKSALEVAEKKDFN